ncbi:hypothetical protein M8994_15565 [Brucella sp. 21LCYQ03]|nr:hypothetical protein [Brucella sp. 21LCYQ03]
MSKNTAGEKQWFQPLGAPKLPQAKMIDGKLTLDFSTIPDSESHIYVSIPHWKVVLETDKMTAYINIDSSASQFAENYRPSYLIKMPKDNISNGLNIAWYTVEDPLFNISCSHILKFYVINSEYDYYYPAPTFPQSKMLDGFKTLDYSKLDATKGAIVDIKYPSMKADQTVVVDWMGFDSAKMPIPETRYQAKIPVREIDAQTNSIASIIPLNFIEPIKSSGTGFAIYRVDNAKSGLEGISQASEVRVVEQIIVPFYLHATTGAPTDDLKQPKWNSWAEATLTGPPGEGFEADITLGAQFVETAQTPYSSTLNKDGLARFRIRSTASLVKINARMVDNSSVTATTSTIFYPHPLSSINGIIAYNYTEHIPADGLVPSIITLSVDPDKINKIELTVTGSALINRVYHSSAKINIDKNGNATVSIYNNVKEMVLVNLITDDGTREAFFTINFY